MSSTATTAPLRDDASGEPATEPVRLSTPARAWRVLLLAVLAGLFAAGTWVGQDDWWPFGPWRMFSTSTPPSGVVNSVGVDVREAPGGPWRRIVIDPASVGVNRAEVEGRLNELVADPAALRTLARTHARLRPDAAPWVAIRVVRDEFALRDGSPTGEVRRTTLASWP